MRVNAKGSVLVVLILNLLILVKMSEGNPSDTRPVRKVTTLKLPKGYESRKPPVVDGKPVSVFFKLFVQTVAPIISADMEFRVNMRMTMTWEDGRLSLILPLQTDGDDEDSDDCDQFLIIPPEVSKNIWHPDPYILNAKYTEIKRFTRKLANMNIYDNHTVSYTMIWNATVACSMNFSFYPLDVQLCPMYIQSFTYDSSLVSFKWAENNPFTILAQRLIQFFVANPPPLQEQLYFDVGRGRNFTELVATFRFERLIGNLLVLTFTPTSLIVSLTWFSFWLELEATAARASLLIISVLTLVTHFSGMMIVLPPVAYVKAVDVWMFGCIFWVFAALAEFVVVKVLYSITEQIRRENLVYSMRKSVNRKDILFKVTAATRPSTLQHEEQSNLSPYTRFWLWDELRLSVPEGKERTKGYYAKKRLGSVLLSGRSAVTTNLPQVHKRFWKWSIPLIWGILDQKRRLWKEIDEISKWLFPITFTIFCIIYWIVLLTHAYLI